MVSKISGAPFPTYAAKQTEHNTRKIGAQLASGKKINTAADNAAGLAISQKLLKEANSLNAYSNNYQSKVNYNNVAEGGLSQISDAYNDMFANSIRAMNGVLSDSDIEAIASNSNALKETANHLSETATYNEQKVISGLDTSFDAMNSDAVKSAASDLMSKQVDFGAETNGLNHAISVNKINAENTIAAQSRIEDTEMNKAVSAYKAQQTIGAFQNMLQRNSMNNSVVSSLFGL